MNLRTRTQCPASGRNLRAMAARLGSTPPASPRVNSTASSSPSGPAPPSLQGWLLSAEEGEGEETTLMYRPS